MNSTRTLTRLIVTVVAFVLSAQALVAYTIVFKDGKSIVALRPYEVVGEDALVTLPSATQTLYPLAEIDIERTEEVNRLGVTAGLLITGSETRVLQHEDVELMRKEETLESLAEIARRNRGRDMSAQENEAAAPASMTRAGNIDLFTLQRRKASEQFTANTLNSRLLQEELQHFGVFEGSRPGTLLVDATVANESEVFAAIRATAAALLKAREELPDLAAVELIMSSARRSKAGQFVITPMTAQEIVSDSVAMGDFFVHNVQF